MKKVLNKLIKHSTLCVLTLVLIALGGYNAKADEIRVGVSPTVLDRIEILPGKEYVGEIEVGNNSILSGDNSDKIFTKVHLNASTKETKYSNLSEEDKDRLLASRWITFDANDFLLSTAQTKKLKFKLDVPKTIEAGEYIASINVSSALVDVDGNTTTQFGISFVPTVAIPVIINVLDGATEKSILVEKYEISKFDMSDSLEKQNTKELIMGLITPTAGIKERWYNFLYRPLKMVGTKDGKEYIKYDIPKEKLVYLKEVIAKDKDSLSNSKYVSLPDNFDTSKVIAGISFENKTINLIDSENKEYKLTCANEEAVIDLRNRITNLYAKFKDAIDSKSMTFTWKYFEDNIQVNPTLGKGNVNLYVKYLIKNTGTKTLMPKGTLSIYGADESKRASVDYSNTVILPNSETPVIASVKYTSSNLGPGKYSIISNLNIAEGKSEEPYIEYFEIVNVRPYIIIGICVGIVLTLGIFIFSIRCLIKSLLRNRRNKLQKSEKVESAI